MKPLRKREFPMYYSKGKKLVHIVVRLSDSPGSLSKILDLLRPKVNFVGTSTYTLGDGTAILSGFAEVLAQDETPDSLQKVLGSTPATIESEVMAGQDGLLVDSFHSGLQVRDDPFMLMNRGGLSSVFDHIVKIFGTGGEVLLYEEGAAMARENAAKMSKALTPEVVRGYSSYLINFLRAQGWGTFKTEGGVGPGAGIITVTDCFECASGSTVRKKCDFIRGYFEGSGSLTLGVPLQVEETQCALRGGKACVFRVSQRRQK